MAKRGRKKKIKEEIINKEVKTDALFPEAKMEKLKKLMNESNRKYKSIVLKFAKDEEIPDKIMFGQKDIDKLTGGLPSKRFNIIWGHKGCGKTTLAYMAIAQAQKLGKLCAFIDLERSFDKARAEYFGVNTEYLLLANEFDTAENALDMLIDLVKAKSIDFIVLDSIQALSPKGEQEEKSGKAKSLESDTMALLARKLSQFFRMSSSAVYKGDVSVLLIGQARTDLGGFIALEKLSGGHALQHWATLTIQARRGPKAEAPKEKVDTGEKEDNGKAIKVTQIVGFQAIIKLEKTKITGSQPEGSDVRIPFNFKKGFNK